MTTTTRTALRLEIGYESRPGIQPADHEAIQKALRAAFDMRGWRDRWHRPFAAKYTSGLPGDTWVADAINREFESYLLQKDDDGRPEISTIQDADDRLGRRLYLPNAPTNTGAGLILEALQRLDSGKESGENVTDCKVSGAEWHDSRSYVLLTQDRTQLWSPSTDAAAALFFFATLTWKCDIQTPVDPVDPVGTAN